MLFGGLVTQVIGATVIKKIITIKVNFYSTTPPPYFD